VQSHYPAQFVRDMGCTEAELRLWLSQLGAPAVTDGSNGLPWPLPGSGTVHIAWRALPPRRIALLALPRMEVRFDAGDAEPQAWQEFMQRFDLHTQRGGG
jgi:hypothetical protein